MARLPPELWIVIFDMAIEEGIVRLDQCDHTTFPYHHVFLSHGKDRYQFYGSYRRLRLVCHSFNGLLGIRPQCDLDPSSFPFPTGIRALNIGGRCGEPLFQQLLGNPSRCGRLVFLKISCGTTAFCSRPHLADLLDAGEGGAFPNVQRLTLLLTNYYADDQISFWTRLHRGFPQLVTLSVEDTLEWMNLEVEPDSVVTFERLEILFIGRGISWPRCHFPRLRHASIYALWGPSPLERFQHSPHLECLLIRSRCSKFSVDVRSFSRLRVMSLPEDLLEEVVPLDCDHTLEHLWLHSVSRSRNPGLIDEIVKRIPRILRITVDLPLFTGDQRTERIQEFKRMRLDSFGLALKPIKLDDNLLVIE